MEKAVTQQDHIFIKNLSPGAEVLQFFQLTSMENRKTKTGQDYMNLVLSDMTGSIVAKVWSNVLKSSPLDFQTGDFVKIKGITQLFGEKIQMNVERIRKADLSEISDLSNLVKKTSFDIDRLYEQLLATVELFDPPELSGLVRRILEQEESNIKIFPAARRIHHAYVGGFLEHTFTVMVKTQALVELIPEINASLAIAGAILHDIGKLREIDPDTRGRTPEGRLKGHIMLGIEMLRAVAQDMGVTSAPWLRELEHIILSHHGEPEFGALVKPLTREAILVHFIDNLDSKLKIIDEALEKTDTNGFSDYNKYLEGRAYSGSHTATED